MYSYAKAWGGQKSDSSVFFGCSPTQFFQKWRLSLSPELTNGARQIFSELQSYACLRFPQHRCYGHAQFYVSAEDLNSAPHIFTANTLPTEPSFQTWALVLLTLYNTFDLCQSCSIYPLFTPIDFPLSGHKESFHSPTGGLLVCVQFQITVHRMKKIFSMDISFHAIMVKYIGVGLLGIPSIY